MTTQARPKRTGRRLKKQKKSVGKGLVRLLACAFLFLSISVVKTAWPDASGYLKNLVFERVAGGVDYMASIEALGRAVNGTGTIKEVWAPFSSGFFGGSDTAAEENGEGEETGQEKPAQSAAPFVSPSPLPSASTDSSPASPEVSPGAQALASRAGSVLPREEQGGGTVDELSFELPEEELLDDTTVSAYVLPMPANVDTTYREITFKTVTPAYGEITSPFGYRDHPVEGGTRFHYGIDIAAPNGSKVACFADGVVDSVGESAIYGKYVRVLHSDGFLSFYGHLSKISLKNGQQVKLGESVGLVGQTGMVTGTHLHFEVRLGDVILNPAHYVKPE